MVRELRHDFRSAYRVAYEEVPVDEAIDLILTLPRGSLWRSAQLEFGEWDEARENAADVVDAIWALISLLSSAHTTEGSPTVTRPGDLRERKAALERARRARERIEGTTWEEA